MLLRIPLGPGGLSPVPVLRVGCITPMTGGTGPGYLLVEATALALPGLELHLAKNAGKV